MKYTDTYIKSDAFLDTFEWRKVRMEAILKYGKRCQCCGAVPLPSNDVKIHVDHIVPRKVDPSLALELSNLQILCNVCNHGKGNWDTTDWRTFEPQETARKYKCNCEPILNNTIENVNDCVIEKSKYLAYDIKIPREVSNLVRKLGFSYRLELNLITANLLFSIAQGVNIAYSRNKGVSNFKIKRNTSVIRVVRAIDLLEKKGLLTNVIGKGAKEKKFRQSSTISPTDKFKEMFATLISNEEFMLKIQQDWQIAQAGVEQGPDRPKPRKKVKKQVLPKNNLKVRKDVMRELLTVLMTWR